VFANKYGAVHVDISEIGTPIAKTTFERVTAAALAQQHGEPDPNSRG
jgi:hypothetical protein